VAADDLSPCRAAGRTERTARGNHGENIVIRDCEPVLDDEPPPPGEGREPELPAV
jgi:hypothetical protein